MTHKNYASSFRIPIFTFHGRIWQKLFKIGLMKPVAFEVQKIRGIFFPCRKFKCKIITDHSNSAQYISFIVDLFSENLIKFARMGLMLQEKHCGVKKARLVAHLQLCRNISPQK